MWFLTEKRIDRILTTGEHVGSSMARAEFMIYLKNRKKEFLDCGKQDTCIDIAYFIDGVIEDLQDEQTLALEEWMEKIG